MIVRQADREDIPALCRLMQFVQEAHVEAHPEVFLPTLDLEATTALLAKLLVGDWDLVLVAEIDGQVVGYIWCEERERTANFCRKPNHSGYIHHVAVAPEQRRSGIGRRLVTEALARLKEQGATRVGVDFWSFNDRARAFFTTLGFAVQREFASRDL